MSQLDWQTSSLVNRAAFRGLRTHERKMTCLPGVHVCKVQDGNGLSTDGISNRKTRRADTGRHINDCDRLVSSGHVLSRYQAALLQHLAQ